jgi:four helix bundle protein
MNKYDLEDRTLEFSKKTISLCRKLSANKIRIAKKEAKETSYWIKLVLNANPNYKEEIISLLNESNQLMKILASIYMKML